MAAKRGETPGGHAVAPVECGEVHAGLRPPHEIFIEVYSACYGLYATGTNWTATDVLRAALSIYLVRQGFRHGYHIPGTLTRAQLSALVGKLSDLEIRDARGVLLVANAFPATTEDPTGCIFPGANPPLGKLTWVCSAGGLELELWSETMPSAASYDVIEPHIRRIKSLLGVLGYTVCLRVE
jgi:hypothetical protein